MHIRPPVFLILLVALLGSAATWTLATAIPPSATAHQEAPPSLSQPETLNHPNAGPAGVYVFYDYLTLDPQRYPIRGGHVSIPWSVIEVGPNSYDWTSVDEWYARQAVRNKYVAFGFNSYDGQCCGGSGVPAHIKQQHPTAVIMCDGVELPRYWDPTYQRSFSEFVQVLGQRYNSDPRIAWFEVSVGIYGETTPAEAQYKSCLEQAGLTSDIWVDVVKWAIDTYVAAFPDKQLFLQYTPVFDARQERVAFTDYAASRGVGLKHNNLRPDGAGDAIINDPDLPYYGGGQYDPLLRWGPQVGLAFEGYENQANSLQGRTATMWGIYNALDKHTDILNLDTPLVRAEDRQDLLRFANTYLGRALSDTPSVWIALRETEFDWFPDYGNFEFWLYQRDSAPGGKSVPLWKIGAAAEGRYTRRTDQATGNASLFFDIDDRYLSSGFTRATITVTYYDQGTDRWELRYDAHDAADKLAGEVRKGNTNTWKKISFPLTDAAFSNRQPGGTDFRIWSAGDGDEIIHFVDVSAIRGESRQAVLQSGVGGYTGATDTTLDAWSPDVNFGAAALLRLRYNAETTVKTHMAPLLRFDLGSLPPQAQITAARLELYLVESTAPTLDMRAETYGLLRSWDEYAATWNQPAAGQTWAAAGAQGRDTDHNATVTSATTVQAAGQWYTLDVTVLAQGWLTRPADNRGLILQAGPGAAAANFEVRFASREAVDTTKRPKLTIDYLIPVTAQPTATPAPTVSPTPTPVPRALISRRVSQPPTLDGDISEWSQPEQARLNAATADWLDAATAPTVADSSAQMWSLWDADWLYLAARIEDDLIYRDSAEIWNDDSMEWALDGADDQLAYGPDDHQFTVASDGTLTEFGADPVPGAQTVVKRRPGGYDVELAIPVAYLKAGPFVEGKLLGFTIGLVDDDDGGNRHGPPDSYMVWQGHNTVSLPRGYGKLVLGAAITLPTLTPTLTGTLATRTNTPTVTPTPTPTRTRTPGPTASVTPSATATHPPTLSPTPTATPIVRSGVHGTVWFDTNRNGLNDAGETGLANREVFLFRSRAMTAQPAPDELIAQTLTGTQGNYHFTDLPPDNYLIAIVPMLGEQPTTPAVAAFSLSATQLDPQVDFGLYYYQNPIYLPLVLIHF